MSNRVNLGRIIGATGQAGQDGARGEKGEAGDTPYIQNGYWWIGTTNTGYMAKGNEWFSGDDVPTSQGVNGDLYLRTNGDVYKKENGVWVFKTNIKGQQGEQGERGESALTFDIGSVTTGDMPSVTNSGTEQDVVLDFVLPKGEKGDKGDKGDSTITVGGFVVSNVNFDSDPQGQLNSKLNNNFGSGNAGRFLQVDENGQVVAVRSSAENDVIDGYYFAGVFYEDEQHTVTITGTEGVIYIDVATNTQYRWNGTQYVPLSADLSGYPTKAQAVGSIELTMNSSTYVLTLQAKNVNGENVGTAQTVDLPLESVVMDIDYDDNNKELVITLNNGNTTRVDISDIVEGLQQTITSTNKLSADLVDDTNSTNKFVTSTEKTQISTNATNIAGLQSSKQNVITSSAKLDADLVDDTSSTNKFVSSAEKTSWNSKANKSTIADYTLVANGWSNNSQTISITGKTANNNARVSNSNTGTDAQVLANSQAIADANIYKITDNGTSLTFVCETTPTDDITIQVEVFE